MILSFFTEGAPNFDGMTLSDMQSQTNEEMESCHSYIQWMFPTAEPSKFSDAPVLDHEIAATLSSSEIAVSNLKKSLTRFCDFLDSDIDNWCHDRNHNLLRITRVIRSLRLFGLEAEAIAFYQKYLQFAVDREIHPDTLFFWELAMTVDPFENLRDMNQGIGFQRTGKRSIACMIADIIQQRTATPKTHAIQNSIDRLEPIFAKAKTAIERTELIESLILSSDIDQSNALLWLVTPFELAKSLK